MTSGLILCLTILGGYVVGFLFDLFALRLRGKRTITDRVEASPNRLAWAVVLSAVGGVRGVDGSSTFVRVCSSWPIGGRSSEPSLFFEFL